MSQHSETVSNRQPSGQEAFWAGDFGDVYTERNAVDTEARKPFFRKVLSMTGPINSVCELGANKGHNLGTLKCINPALQITGVELNPQALAVLQTLEGITAVHSAIQDFKSTQSYDLVYTCGVLIHLNPDDLPATYQKMVQLSSKYILINEYFNPSPVALEYRGHAEKLFKRDFGREFLEANEGQVRVVEYGFLWQTAEPAWDNTTWWLFEKIATPSA